jgi:diguanylate cyclase (GGDEF)-like protein
MVETSSSTPPGVHCVSSAKLAHFLKREQRASSVTELDLDRIFRELLQRANDFLPSEAGTIYLDDPLDVDEDGGRLSLVVIAGFGPKSEDLMEERFSTAMGIIGEVYRTGQPYSCSEPLADPIFRSGPGLRIGFTIESVVGAPIEVEGRTIGVIELINHSSGQGYSEADLALLGIFAQTISLSVVNAIDAQRAKEIAKRDELTELYNDRYLHGSLSKIIDEAVASGSECGIIFLDLDHFKEVNDTHGHLVGSQLLSKVGATLKQIIPGEGLAARYGGDEFVIALPGAGRQETLWVAETIRQNIADQAFIVKADPDTAGEGPDLRIDGVITCSIGIATLQSDIMPALSAENGDAKKAKDQLLRKADTCMYAAKELGRNRTIPYWELARLLATGIEG